MICKKLLLLLLAVVFCVTSSGFADNPIRGFLIDATSAEPLPVANVVLEGTTRGAFTNLDGYFVIDYLEQGTYTLRLSHLGYHTKRQEVEVTEQLMEPIYIELVPEAVQLEEVVVTVEKEDTRMDPVVSHVPLEKSVIKTMPTLGGEMDVLRVLQMVPGVKASSEISSGIYVRGGSPDQTLILMDHNVVYNPNHMFGLFSTFNADATKRVNLMKGGFPAEYGGRSGSVLEIITNEGNRKEIEGVAMLGILSNRASLEGPLPKNRGSFALSGRRTYLDPVIAYLRNSLDEDLPDYYFYDFNGKLNLDLTNHSTLTTAGYWGNDNLDLEFGPDDNRTDLHLSWGNRTLTSRYRQVLSRNLFWATNAAVSRYRSKTYVENSGSTVSEMYDRLYDYSLKSDLEFLGARNHHIKIGAAVNRYHFTLRILNYEITEVDVDKFSTLLSGYVEDSWRIHPMLEVKPGLRGYYYNRGDYVRIDPRLACVLHYDVDMRFKVAGGRYSQFISLINFGEGMSNFDIWVPIDETLDPSYSDQVVVGFEWDPKRDLELTAEVYYTDMHELVEFDQIQMEEAENAADPYLTDGRGFAYGLELMLTQKKGRLTGWVGYSLSWTKRRFADSYLNDGDWFYPIWDRRHDFIINASYALNHRWELSGTWRYHTGQGFTQSLGQYASRHAIGGYDLVLVDGDLNNYRFPADHRLDLSATYKHHFWFNLPARLNFGVYNAYSRRPYWRRVVDLDESPPEIEDIKLLPILPMISYEVRF